MSKAFCLVCGDDCCLHLMKSRRFMLSLTQVRILRALMRPDLRNYKQIAYELGLTTGTVKVNMCEMYRRLGWIGGSDRELTLWAIANRDKLGVELPSPDQFPRPVGPPSGPTP